MKALDEYDIRESFEALDTECWGSITMTDLHTIYLALGYRPDDLTVQDLQIKAGVAAPTERLSLERVLEILSKVSELVVVCLCTVEKNTFMYDQEWKKTLTASSTSTVSP
jgi:Ca2+-binding EF-hand superfamily protein